jgi:hypothetical protein
MRNRPVADRTVSFSTATATPNRLREEPHTAWKDTNMRAHALHNRSRPFAQRQGATGARTQRRARYIQRIASSADAENRWALLLLQLGRQFDIADDDLDRVLDRIVDADPSALKLLELAGAAR